MRMKRDTTTTAVRERERQREREREKKYRLIIFNSILIFNTIYFLSSNYPSHHPIYSIMNPQRIIELQKHYQNTPKPLWLRGRQSAFLVYPFYALFAVSTAIPLYYSVRAVAGIKDE